MKHSWKQLTGQNKKIFFNSAYLIFTIILICSWLILSNKTKQLEKNIQYNHGLLFWMQAADHKLRNTLPLAAKKTNNITLPSNIQMTLEQAGLKKQIKQLRQNENGSVLLSLENANFDNLIIFLNKLQQKTNTSIAQIHITRSADIGQVSVNMVLD